jgi:DnaK suppressor protein
MTKHHGHIKISDVQAQAIAHELREQLLWRTNRLDELRALVGVAGDARPDVLADLAATERGIAEVRESLNRLADRTYGECVDCGTAIPFERLKVRPLARHCMPCRRLHEAR